MKKEKLRNLRKFMQSRVTVQPGLLISSRKERGREGDESERGNVPKMGNTREREGKEKAFLSPPLHFSPVNLLSVDARRNGGGMPYSESLRQLIRLCG